MKKLYLLLPILFTCLFTLLHAQDGKLDLTFAPVSGADASIQKMALQSDGKIIIVGSFTTYDGIGRTGIARLNSNGTLDQSFDPGSGIFIDWGQYARAVAVQQDGKILMGGTFTNYNNNYTNRIVRINTDGSYDPSFDATNVPGFSGINGEVDVIKVQADGKILVGGPFTGSGSFKSKNIIRFKPNGSVDSGFVVGDGANSGTGASSVADLAIQPDGKIIVVGSFQKFDATVVNHIVRLKADGSLDTSFKTGTGADNSIQAVTLQPDGKIIISGWFHSINGETRWNIARLNSDGSLDASFVSNLPAIPNSYINCHDVQPDGKIIVNAGWTRLLNNGEKDTLAWHNGSFAGGGLSDILIQPDGKILMSGAFVSFDGTTRNRILRLNGNSVSINERSEPASVLVYPNPSKGLFHIQSATDLAEIKIFNLLGETVYSENLNTSLAQIDLTGQAKGVYFFRVIDQNKALKTGKIVVE